MENWWSEVENDLLQCLRDGGGAMTPGDIGRRVGLSEAATSSLLAMLVRDGKVRICLVERTTLDVGSDGPDTSEAPRNERRARSARAPGRARRAGARRRSRVA